MCAEEKIDRRTAQFDKYMAKETTTGSKRWRPLRTDSRGVLEALTAAYIENPRDAETAVAAFAARAELALPVAAITAT